MSTISIYVSTITSTRLPLDSTNSTNREIWVMCLRMLTRSERAEAERGLDHDSLVVGHAVGVLPQVGGAPLPSVGVPELANYI